MNFDLSIKFNNDYKINTLVDRILTIPECINHKIKYTDDGRYRQIGEIPSCCNDTLSKITQLIGNEGLNITELNFNIKK